MKQCVASLRPPSYFAPSLTGDGQSFILWRSRWLTRCITARDLFGTASCHSTLCPAMLFYGTWQDDRLHYLCLFAEVVLYHATVWHPTWTLHTQQISTQNLTWIFRFVTIKRFFITAMCQWWSHPTSHKSSLFRKMCTTSDVQQKTSRMLSHNRRRYTRAGSWSGAGVYQIPNRWKTKTTQKIQRRVYFDFL